MKANIIKVLESNPMGGLNAGVLVDANLYEDLLIGTDDWSGNYPDIEVHGGVTLYRWDKPKKEYIWSYNGQEIDYDKEYLLILWDTLHWGDTFEMWTKENVIKENDMFAERVREAIDKLPERQ